MSPEDKAAALQPSVPTGTSHDHLCPHRLVVVDEYKISCAEMYRVQEFCYGGNTELQLMTELLLIHLQIIWFIIQSIENIFNNPNAKFEL